MERWYTSQLQPEVQLHSTTLFRRREKVAKVLEGRNAYSKMVEDEAIGRLSK